MSVSIVYYHDNCMDGFASAVAANYTLGADAIYYAARYDKPLPDIDYSGRHVYFVDFSAPNDVIKNIAEQAEAVVIIDHHSGKLDDYDELIKWNYYRDNKNLYIEYGDEAGCVLTWKFFNNDPVPELLRYVGDRDTWAFKYGDHSRYVHAYLLSIDKLFDVWDEHLFSAQIAIEKGEVLYRAQQHKIKTFIENLDENVVSFGSHNTIFDSEKPDVKLKFPVINVSEDISETLNAIIATGKYLVAVNYFDRGNKRNWSIRSATHSIDVSTFAKIFGGGGHARASGFVTHRPAALADLRHKIYIG